MIFSDGITESARKDIVWNGEGSVQPSFAAASMQPAARLDHLVERRLRDQARDRQRQLGAHAAVLDDDHAAADLGQARDRAGHVVVVHADDDDVVRVVGEGRGERARLEVEAAHEPDRHPAGAEVALDDRDLREAVPGDRVAVLDERAPRRATRSTIWSGITPITRARPALPGDGEVARGDVADAHGVLDPLRHLGPLDLAERRGRA